MTTCRGWNDRLLDFSIGALTDGEARAVERHVKSCTSCAGMLSEVLARSEQIDAAVRHLVGVGQLSPAFLARVLARVETGEHAEVDRPLAARLQAGVDERWIPLIALIVVIAATLISLPLERWWATDGDRLPSTVLAGWRSPTEGLLHGMSDELLRSKPELGQFYFRVEPIVQTRHGTEPSGTRK